MGLGYAQYEILMTKLQNSSDPERYTNPVMEGAGAVASDSLAAESAKSGGKFGENRNSEPLSVSGSSSTFNNTDTSGVGLFDALSTHFRLFLEL